MTTVLSKIERVTNAGIDETYIIYDTGRIVRTANGDTEEDLEPDNLSDDLKLLLLKKADSAYEITVSQLLEISEFDNLDFLFNDAISHSFYRKYTDLLACKLSLATLRSIRDNHIILLLAITPGSVIHNFRYPESLPGQSYHVVILDHNLIRYCQFSEAEVSALILHEFGHIFNNPTDQSQKEFYADYFAKQNGFGLSLSSALQKLHDKNLAFIPAEFQKELQERINELQNLHQFPLTGTEKSLR